MNMGPIIRKWMLSGVYRHTLWPGAKIRYSRRHNKIIVSNASGSPARRTNKYAVVVYYMNCFDQRSYYVDSWYRYWYYQLKEYFLGDDLDE